MATLEEYKRFVANEPETQREIRTLEIWHPQFDQVYRFVNDYVDLNATIEDGAPRDSGETVSFEAVYIGIEEPAQRQDSEQVLTVTMGDVDDRLDNIISQISGDGYLTQIDVVYRKYYSGDLTQPAITPLYLSGSQISFENSELATFTAEDTDLAVKRAGVLYTTEFFPGLR